MGRARRWAWHLLVALITAVLASLGFWQIGRHQQLVERNALLVERLAAEPRPYRALTSELDPDAPAGAPADARNRPVTLAGRFDPQHEVLLRGQTHDKQPGYHVLTPLILTGESGGSSESGGAGGSAGSDDAGRAVLVDRGWVPYQIEDPALPSYAPPPGTVRVTGRLMPEADLPQGFLAGLAPRDPATGVLSMVARADVDRLQQQTPYPLDPYLVEAEAIEPVAAEGAATVEEAAVAWNAELPILPPRPGPEAGPHVGYAIQWFAFALTAAIGYLILIRRR